MTSARHAPTLARDGTQSRKRTGSARLPLGSGRAGTSRSDWASTHGIDPRSLDTWRISLDRTTARGARGPLAGLRLVEFVPTSPPAQPHYVVHIVGVEVVIYDDFREDTLVLLVRALR